MIAEDDAFLRCLMGDMLQSHGYNVAAFSGGEDAVVAAREMHAEVMITDIMMENGEGISTIMNARKSKKNILIIAVSSNDRYLNYAKKIGADHILKKPLRCRELLEAVRTDDQASRKPIATRFTSAR